MHGTNIKPVYHPSPYSEDAEKQRIVPRLREATIPTLAAEASVLSKGSVCGSFVEQSDTRARFSPRTSVLGSQPAPNSYVT
jgi:hypothetical protein